MIDISVTDLVKSFDLEKKILDGVSFQIDTGERVGLLGKNGAGKSTLFNILTGELDYDSGQVLIAPGRRVGLISQIPVYPEGYTVEDVLRSAFQRTTALKEEMDRLTRQMEQGDSDPQTLRRYGELTARFEGLGGYDTDTAVNKVSNGLSIDGDMRQRLFDQLSGGEKTRVNLGRLILEDTDILLLDEPTNHLDLQATEWLEEYLGKFKGTVLTVSHDRYFLDNVVDRIFEFDGNGNLLQYEGGYTDYLEAKERRFGGSAEETAKAAPSKTSADEPAKSKNNDWKQNRPTRLKFTFKEQREYETIDDDIAVLEEKIASLDDQMLKNATNSAKLAELMVEKEKTEAALEEKTERWVYLTDLAEQIEAQNQK